MRRRGPVPSSPDRYSCGMPELIEPTGRLQAAWLDTHAEWGPGVHEDGFGLLPTDDVDSPAGFAAWVERLAGESGRCTHFWIIEGGRVLGMERMLVVCGAENEASAKTIERHGGILEDDDGRGAVLRYWINTRVADD